MDKDILNKYRKAGQIAADCLQYGKGLMQEGAVIREVCDKVEAKIEELGGKPAFPTQISLNTTAAHFCPGPGDDRTLESHHVAKLDVGVHVDGYVGDNAVTVDLSGQHSDVVQATRKALKMAVEQIRPGMELREVGRIIQDAIASFDMAPIRNLSGHGLDRFVIHDKPTIPNYDNGDTTTLQEGMVIAIEPFATSGEGYVIEADQSELFSLQQERPVRSRFARKILKEIKQYNGLPFTTRWLTKKLPQVQVQLGLKELMQKSVLTAYPPLVERGEGIVSQAEHTILLKEEPEILTLPSE